MKQNMLVILLTVSILLPVNIACQMIDSKSAIDKPLKKKYAPKVKEEVYYGGVSDCHGTPEEIKTLIIEMGKMQKRIDELKDANAKMVSARSRK